MGTRMKMRRKKYNGYSHIKLEKTKTRDLEK